MLIHLWRRLCFSCLLSSYRVEIVVADYKKLEPLSGSSSGNLTSKAARSTLTIQVLLSFISPRYSCLKEGYDTFWELSSDSHAAKQVCRYCTGTSRKPLTGPSSEFLLSTLELPFQMCPISLGFVETSIVAMILVRWNSLYVHQPAHPSWY